MSVNCQVLPNGDLLVTAQNDVRADIAYGLKEHGYWGTFAEAFEQYSANGSYAPFDAGDANPFVGLTSSPCIAECLDYEEDGECTVQGRLWWYPNYMVEDPLEELKNRGRAVFTLAS